eukprot:322187-Pelagomonas_calceolata.AAC.2
MPIMGLWWTAWLFRLQEDHGDVAVVFCVPDVVPNADWTPSPEHACGMGRCASKLSRNWKHERQHAYVEELERNLEMQVQLEAALDAGNINMACFAYEVE